MIFTALITFNREHIKNEEEGRGLVLAFLNQINIGSFACLPIENSEELEIQNKLHCTEVYKKFLEDPESYKQENQIYEGKYSNLCNFLEWWCCSPVELFNFAEGTDIFLELYKFNCEVASDPVRIIDLDLDDENHFDIKKKYVAVVNFHC